MDEPSNTFLAVSDPSDPLSSTTKTARRQSTSTRVTRASTRQREQEAPTVATSIDKSIADTKGKKRAKPTPSPSPSPAPESSELSELESEPEPPKKKQRRGSASKPKAKAPPKPRSKGKGKAKAKMPRKPTAPRTKSAAGSSNERAKKGDLASFLHDDDMNMDDGDEANWVEDEPSRMDDDHDEDDDEDEEEGAAAAGPSSSSGMPSDFSNPFSRGFGGMDIDADTAAAIFGGGFRAFGGGSSAISNRLKRLRADLKSPKSATRLQALQECSEILLVATEDTLAGHFSIEGFSKEFIAILDGKPNITGPPAEDEMEDEDAQLAAALAMSTGEEMPGFGGDAEAQLVACRCLAHLLEALPGTGHVLVHLGAVRVLCSKLKEISYIELAEQTLSTLEKISQETPSHVVREGGLGALLNFLDFFSTNVQRTAVTAAAHCCKNISLEAYPSIREVFPVLRQVLSYSDQRLVEQATLAVVRTLEAYRTHATQLEGLLDTPTVSAINALLIPSGGSPLISSPTYTLLLKVLTTAARASPKVAIAFLEAGMTDTLYQILTGVLPARDEGESGQVTDMAVLQNLAHRPKEQVEEALALITELLPPLPKDGVFDSRAYTERALQKLNRPSRSSSKVDTAARASTPKPKRDSEIRTELLKSKPDLVAGFTRSIVPVLVDVFAASVSHRVRYKVLAGLLKAVAFAEPGELQVVLNSVPMASFLASIISSKDNPTFVLCALQLVECLIDKLPQVYHASFQREGVVYEVEQLAAQEPQPKPPVIKAEPVESSATTEEDTKPVIPPEPTRLKVPPTPADLHDANIHRARMLGAKRTFETEDGNDEAAVAMQRLEQLVASLINEDADEAQHRETLRSIASLFQDADKALSSFELLKSGLIDGLLTFVTMTGNVSQDVRRALLFEAFSAGPSDSLSPLTMLVKRLHESLSRLEDFEVETVKAGREELNRFAGSPLTRSVRIRLAPEETGDSAKPAMPLSISIQGIAPMQMLHDYIRPRIAAGNNGDRGGMAAIMEALAQSGGASSAVTARLLAALNTRGPNGAPDLNALRAALGGVAAPSAAASSSTGAGPSSTSAQASIESTDAAAKKPQRRRSARLSAVDVPAEGSTAAEPTLATTDAPAENSDAVPLSSAVAALGEGLDMDVDFDDDEGYSDEDFDHEIFEEDMEEDMPPPPEKTVDMDVAPDGTTVIAKTPDGTRVPTPAQGSSTPAGSSAKQGSYASAVKAPPIDWHLEFRLDGHKLSMADTVYGAVHKYGQSRGDPTAFNAFHSNQTIHYRKVPGPAPPVEDVMDVTTSPEPSSTASLPASLTQDGPTAKILRLLSVVHSLTADARDLQAGPQLDETLFVNNKLTAKLTRQLEETMIVASSCMPDWSVTLPVNYPFLFPFETRYSFLQSSAFGNERLLLRWQAAQPRSSSRRDDGISNLIRLPRNKVRISRTSIFESAAKVLDLYGGGLGILEVEYFDEIGTGLGPTLEFYTLVSKEFARRSLGIWRDEDTAKVGESVIHPKGLFPSPMESETSDLRQAKLRHFKSLGLFVARALLDSRIIDVNLNRLFLKLILGHRVPKTFASLKLVDADFARNLEALHAYAVARHEIQHITALPPDAKTDKLAAITVNGASIEDLSLDFTLPGYDIELKPGGRDTAVDNSNVDEYLDRILDLTLGAGVEAQVQAFRDGFSAVLSVRDLALFAPEELILLFGNADEDWSRETLEQSLKADHGYNSDSRAVKNLLDTMASYDKSTRREFLQFVTGAPKLPIGGFRGLNPPFTVVRKPHEAPYKADDYLPSVMTCAQYLKMPDYTTREVLETQLGRAMREGGQAFHLS